jgi:hypothetical protein
VRERALFGSRAFPVTLRRRGGDEESQPASRPRRGSAGHARGQRAAAGAAGGARPHPGRGRQGLRLRRPRAEGERRPVLRAHRRELPHGHPRLRARSRPPLGAPGPAAERRGHSGLLVGRARLRAGQRRIVRGGPAGSGDHGRALRPPRTLRLPAQRARLRPGRRGLAAEPVLGPPLALRRRGGLRLRDRRRREHRLPGAGRRHLYQQQGGRRQPRAREQLRRRPPELDAEAAPDRDGRPGPRPGARREPEPDRRLPRRRVDRAFGLHLLPARPEGQLPASLPQPARPRAAPVARPGRVRRRSRRGAAPQGRPGPQRVARLRAPAQVRSGVVSRAGGL